MSDIEINRKQQYVLSYDDKDFYSVSLYNGGALSYCPKRENYDDKNDEHSRKSCDGARDVDFKDKLVVCDMIDSICENVKLYNEIKKIQTSHSGSDSRFSDINDIQKTEILKTINLGIGIMVMANIIYNYI